MPSECYPSRAFCIRHNHGGIHRVNQVKANERTGPIGGLAIITESRKRGKQLETAGKVQWALAATSTPKGKIWVPYTKKQHRLQRKGRAGGTLYGAKVSSKKYDYRPSGPSHAAQDRHFRRQPKLTGYQPGTGPRATKKHRRTQRIKGGGKIVGGKFLPFLGYGIYGYSILRSDDPLGEVVKDITWAASNPLDAAWRLSGAEDIEIMYRFGIRQAGHASARAARHGVITYSLPFY